MAETGYFNAYGNVVRKDNVDYVVHLGDYIYESADGVVGKDERATHPEHELFTLYDYRARIGQVCCASISQFFWSLILKPSQYRTDVDLVNSHQNFPWIQVWDDHGTSVTHRLKCEEILTV